MEVKECIILAGGLGTRLRGEITGVPKCMAPVAGEPFLHWLLQYLISQQVSTFIFSVGYLQEKIREYIASSFPQLDVKFSSEDSPLGTGGAMSTAMKFCRDAHVMAVNGDTLFEADIKQLLYYHMERRAACTLALKPMTNYDRYGSVNIDGSGTVTSFTEKKQTSAGLINGGVYVLDRLAFEQLHFPEIFSFEKDYLEKYNGAQKITGVPDDGYFIDIGIPEDLRRADNEIKSRRHV